ncbi:MAG: sugar transferase [Pirellulales bacterium]
MTPPANSIGGARTDPRTPLSPHFPPDNTPPAEELRPRTDSAAAISVSIETLESYGAEKSMAYERTKRVLDVIVASAALLVLAPPMVVIALWIKLTDYGPVLFRQVRVGRGGREFVCYKFRSMVMGADELKEQLQAQNHHQNSFTFKMRRDPRVTRVGWLIRKTSMDELPQLWNVIQGDMSIVGPRPPVPSEVAWYTPYHLRRLEVKPGLTCIWQVSGRGDIPFEQQMVHDLQYIENRSLWLDLSLIFKTIPAVVSGKGAY